MSLHSRGRDADNGPVTKREVDASVSAAMQRVEATCVTPADVPKLSRYMKQKGIKDVEQGVASFLRDKRAGAAEAGPDEFGVDDIEGIQRYAKANSIDLAKPGVYEATLERYKLDKREGKVERYRT